MSIRFIGAVWDSGLYDGPRLLMMLALADHADDDGWCYPNYDTLALKIRRNLKTVYRVLSDLEGEGAIRRHDGRIGICDPQILDEVRRRAQSRHQRPVDPPAEPLQPPDPILNIENPSPNGTAAPILKIEKEILKNKNRILTPEKEILKNETPFYIDPSINHQSNRQEPTATAPAAEPPAAVAAAAADPLAPILDWIAFDDALTPQERAALTVSDLLAWAYWVKLKQAERGSRVYNPVGLVRAQWRKGQPPRADLQRLARAWLFMDDDRRARLLGRLEWVVDFGPADDPDSPLADEYPDIPLAAAAAVYTATAGELAPPSLTPPREATPPPPASTQSTPSTASTPHGPTWPHWKDALAELEMQMTKATFAAWLQGSTATLDGDHLTVHLINAYAVDWVTNRLDDLIQRTVDHLAGRPITITYTVREEATP